MTRCENIVENGLLANIEALISLQRESKVLLRKQQEEEKRKASPMASEETKTSTLPATSGIEAENAIEMKSKLSPYYVYEVDIWPLSLHQFR